MFTTHYATSIGIPNIIIVSQVADRARYALVITEIEMDNELIEARARDYANSFLLTVLIAIQKQITPNFSEMIANSFDEYIGRNHLGTDNEFTKAVVTKARTRIKEMLESDEIIVTLKK